MRDFIEAGLGIVVAFLLYTVLSKISLFFIQIFNVFTLVVIYFAIEKGEIFGACLGTICGLIQDTFSLGIFGLAGLSKTVTGFVAGSVSGKINVVPLARNFVFVFILISLESLLWIFLHFFIFSERVQTGGRLLLLQPLSTAFIGSLLFLLLRKIKYGKQQNL